MALFRLLDEKDEFGEAFGALLARRLLTFETTAAMKSATEAELLALLSSTCGPAFTSHFDRMHTDIQSKQAQTSIASVSGTICLLTGGTWSIKGKRLLPGHPIFTSLARWPEPAIIATFEKAYLSLPAHRSRRLNWIPALSEVEFDLILPGNEKRISLRASCAQLAILQQLVERESGPILQDDINSALMAPMIRAGLLNQDGTLTGDWNSVAPIVDVFTPLVTELLSTSSIASGASGQHQMRPFSTTGTPSRESTVTGAYSTPLSPTDKQTLLQSQITRLLKQLRSLTLAELYNRLSMLPVLLSRFSPEIEEVDSAVRGLAEKEFLQVVLVERGESVLSNENGIKEAMNELSADCIHIRYLA